jgi:hypothetical protein
MRKGRFSQEQIINVLKEQQADIPVVELCRKHGISDATFSCQRKPCPRLLPLKPTKDLTEDRSFAKTSPVKLRQTTTASNERTRKD